MSKNSTEYFIVFVALVIASFDAQAAGALNRSSSLMAGSNLSSSISISPSSYAMDVGQNITLNSTLAGVAGNVVYQWYNATGSSEARVMPGANAPAYTLYGLAPEHNLTYYLNATYYFNATNGTAHAVLRSNNASVSIYPAISAGIAAPSTPSIDNGQSIALTANASGGTAPYSYQWYSGISATCSSDSPISGATSNMYSASPTSGTYYCYKVTDSATTPESATSVGDLVTFNPALSTEAVAPFGPTIDNGQSIALTANASGGTAPYSYQWYTGASCNAAISGATNSVYSASPTSDTAYSYRVTDSAAAPESQCSLSSVNSITPGFNLSEGVAFSPSGTYAYVTNYKSDNVAIVNTATNTVAGSITPGFSFPSGVAISPSGAYAYVANLGNIVIVNTATNTVVNSITSGFSTPEGVAFSPSGTYAYITNCNTSCSGSGADNVVIVNTATNTVTASISSGFNDPTGVAFSPSGTYAYVANAGSNNVVIVNTATNTVAGSVTSGFFNPEGVAFSPSGAHAYVTNGNGNSNNVVIVNTATNTVTGSITSGFSGPFGVSFSPSGAYAYVTDYNTDNVVIVNTPEVVNVDPALNITTDYYPPVINITSPHSFTVNALYYVNVVGGTGNYSYVWDTSQLSPNAFITGASCSSSSPYCNITAGNVSRSVSGLLSMSVYDSSEGNASYANTQYFFVTANPDPPLSKDYLGRNVSQLASMPLRIGLITPGAGQIVYGLGLGNDVVAVTALVNAIMPSFGVRISGNVTQMGLNYDYYLPDYFTKLVNASADYVPIDAGAFEGTLSAGLADFQATNISAVVIGGDFARNASMVESDIMLIANTTNTTANGTRIVNGMNNIMYQVRSRVSGAQRPTVAMINWYGYGSMYVDGAGSFIGYEINYSNAQNIFPGFYPSPSVGQLISSNPDYIIASIFGTPYDNISTTYDSLASIPGIQDTNAWKDGHVYILGNLATNITDEPGQMMAYGILLYAVILHPSQFGFTQSEIPNNITSQWVMANIKPSLYLRNQDVPQPATVTTVSQLPTGVHLTTVNATTSYPTSTATTVTTTEATTSVPVTSADTTTVTTTAQITSTVPASNATGSSSAGPQAPPASSDFGNVVGVLTGLFAWVTHIVDSFLGWL